MKALALRCEKAPGKEALKKYKDVQLIDPSCIAGEEHLTFAISQAKKAFERKENVSKNPLIEVMVRASLGRQIKNALEIFGLRGSNTVITISEKYPNEFIEEYGCSEDESILNVDEKKYEKIKNVFDIGEVEIRAVSGGEFDEKVATLKRIIAERIALL